MRLIRMRPIRMRLAHHRTAGRRGRPTPWSTATAGDPRRDDDHRDSEALLAARAGGGILKPRRVRESAMHRSPGGHARAVAALPLIVLRGAVWFPAASASMVRRMAWMTRWPIVRMPGATPRWEAPAARTRMGTAHLTATRPRYRASASRPRSADGMMDGTPRRRRPRITSMVRKPRSASSPRIRAPRSPARSTSCSGARPGVGPRGTGSTAMVCRRWRWTVQDDQKLTLAFTPETLRRLNRKWNEGA